MYETQDIGAIFNRGAHAGTLSAFIKEALAGDKRGRCRSK